jgi:methionine biosynthesis protein MetW
MRENFVMREDFREILRLVEPSSRVLDIGCGHGDLLELLTELKAVDGRGVEISSDGVAAALGRGLAVMQGDADRDLEQFPTDAFDYAVLSQTLQATRAPREVLSEMLRIAKFAIVSFPNFGHWRVMASLVRRGRMPETRSLPLPWWSTPNIHLCTLRDFLALVEDLDFEIRLCCALNEGHAARKINPANALENLRAESALFLLSRKSGSGSEKRPQADM